MTKRWKLHNQFSLPGCAPAKVHLSKHYISATTHCYYTRSNPKRKGLFLFCLPALLGIQKNPKKKEVFEIQRGILEGCTNRARPSRPSRPCLKNCLHVIWKKMGQMTLFKGYESAIVWIYPKYVSGSACLAQSK